jgi:hypothetical protein
VSTDPTEESFRASPLFQELERHAKEEDWDSFESEAKRHHFVPRFVLARFARRTDRGDVLFQLNVDSGTPNRIRPEDAASRRHFYRFDYEGRPSNRVEGFLSVVESHAAPALIRLLERPEALQAADRATLSFFFALLDARTPGATDRMAVSSNAIMRMLFTTELADLEKFAATFRELFGEASNETIEEFRQEMLASLKEGRVEFADPRAQALALNMSAAGAAAPVAYQMHWTLLQREGAFITSDRGLAMYDPQPRFPWSGQAWLSSANVEITIPLSSDCCLFIGHGEEGTEVVEVSDEQADGLNLRTYGWADEYIYGHSQELVTRVRRLAKRRPVDIVRPIPQHHVLLLEADPADRSLAKEHVRRGWPAYLRSSGVLHDYVVVGPEMNPVEALARVNGKVRERALRALGRAPHEELLGRAEFEPADLEDG